MVLSPRRGGLSKKQDLFPARRCAAAGRERRVLIIIMFNKYNSFVVS
jgi:hypothetical protein